MPEECQLLPPDKTRDPDKHILITHLESLLLLSSTRAGRETLRKTGVYPIVRETHMHADDDDVEEACDRIVQVIMPEQDFAEDKTFEEVHEEEEDESAMVEIV